MKGEYSSLDLYYLIKELKLIIGSKIDKVFQKENKVVFQLHSSDLGKRYLCILLPGFIWLSTKKEDFSEVENFSMSLRKHLTNARIVKIEQMGFERIIKIEVHRKDSVYKIYVEIFRPGNIILCNSEDNILMAKEYKGFGSRIIRPNVKYDYPKKEFNLLELKEKDLIDAFDKTDKASIVISLAVDLGLGGVYAEEICNISGIDKKKTRIGHDEVKKVYNAIKELKDNFSPSIYYDNETIFDIAPIELSSYKEKKHEKMDSFNLGMAKYLDEIESFREKTKKMSRYDNEKKKLSSIIKSQEIQIKGLEKSAEEAQSKGEAIYSNYPALNKVIEDLAKARKTYSLKEIKEKLKGHKIIKDLDEKYKKIAVEV